MNRMQSSLRVISLLLLTCGSAAWAQQAGSLTLKDDNARCAKDSSVQIDTFANDDFNGLNTTFLDFQIGRPRHGEAVRGQLPGEVIYVPNPGFVGRDAFDYTVSDPNTGATDTAIVNVLVLDAANLIGAFLFAQEICDPFTEICTIEAQAVVANNGSACACPVACQIYLSVDEQLSPDDRKFGRFLTGQIDPDIATDVPFQRRLARGKSVRGQFLIVKVDATNRLTEVRENDNVSFAIPISNDGKECRDPRLTVVGTTLRVDGCDGIFEVELRH
jgi:hypothetical protein